MIHRQYKVKVIYKSGAAHEFWAKSFTIRGERITWLASSAKNKPLEIGLDDVSAIYQVGIRYRFGWKK